VNYHGAPRSQNVSTSKPSKKNSLAVKTISISLKGTPNFYWNGGELTRPLGFFGKNMSSTCRQKTQLVWW